MVAVTFMRHRELHPTGRIGWLRAAVLGANDRIVSTASLVVGIAAADASTGEQKALLIGLVLALLLAECLLAARSTSRVEAAQ